MKNFDITQKKLREVDWMDEDWETGQANSTANTW